MCSSDREEMSDLTVGIDGGSLNTGLLGYITQVDEFLPAAGVLGFATLTIVSTIYCQSFCTR